MMLRASTLRSAACVSRPRSAAGAVVARPAGVFRQRHVQVRAERDPENRGNPASPPTADEFLAEGTRPRNFWDVMTFAGPAPEVTNGRLAMLGFTAAVAAELATGRGVVQQFQQAPVPILLTFAVFVIASLTPILRGANLEKKYSFWRPNAEIINGRAAMVGLVALLVTEYIKGQALWGV